MSLVSDTSGRHGSNVAGWYRGIQAVSGLLCCSRGHAQRQGKPKGAGPGKAPGPAPWWCTSVLMALCFNHHACAGHGVSDGPCVLDGPFWRPAGKETPFDKRSRPLSRMHSGKGAAFLAGSCLACGVASPTYPSRFSVTKRAMHCSISSSLASAGMAAGMV